MERAKIFISYSHKDEKWRHRLANHLSVLAREGLVDNWDDQKLGAGEDFLSRIGQEMLQARVAVLLISADFLTSEFIRTKEVPLLFERHLSGGMTIFPLLVRDCAWQEVPWLARMQLRPRDAKPVAARPAKVDHIMAEVAREIAALVSIRVPSPSMSHHISGEVERLTNDFEGLLFDLLHSMQRLSDLVADGKQNQDDGLRLQNHINDTAWAMRAKGDQLVKHPALKGEAHSPFREAAVEVYGAFALALNNRAANGEQLNAKIAEFRAARARI
jgi:hypothetical protein